MTTPDLRTVVLRGLNIYESMAVQEGQDVNSEVAVCNLHGSSLRLENQINLKRRASIQLRMKRRRAIIHLRFQLKCEVKQMRRRDVMFS